MKNITEIIIELKNKPCWRAWRGAGYTVYLELGDKLPNRPGEQELRKGEFSIGLTSCPWSVYKDDIFLFGTDSSYSEIDEALSILEGKKIQEVTLNDELNIAEIQFSDKILIKISYEDPRDEWCILTSKAEAVISKEKIEINTAEVF